LEPAWWLTALAFFFVFPDYLAVATSVLVMALFALSLDLLLGFAGSTVASARGVLWHRRLLSRPDQLGWLEGKP